MFHHRINAVSAKKAFSLVEILISLSLSTFLLMIFSQQYSNQYIKYSNQTVLLDLQKTAHQILDYIKPHIEHIGFLSASDEESNQSLFAPINNYYLEKNCLMFIYDLNQDGCIGDSDRKYGCINRNINRAKEISKESFGIKLQNQEIYIYDNGNQFEHCIGKECAKLLAQCQSPNWHRITYREQYQVENLSFEWLKIGKTMKISINLVSSKQPAISYSAYSIVSLLNTE